MDKKINNRKICEILAKKYNLPLNIIQRTIRLGIASSRRAMATNKRVQFQFGHFVFSHHPQYSGFIKNGKRNRSPHIRGTKVDTQAHNTQGLAQSNDHGDNNRRDEELDSDLPGDTQS